MGAPKGNKFWKLRSKHGRDKLFKNAKCLLEAAYTYFEWIDQNPWMKNEMVKSGENAGDIYEVPTSRPYTLTGLCIYLDINTHYFREFKIGIEGKKDKKSKDFSAVISSIEEIIYTQKFEGAAVGAFNANIISRDLGLIDKTNIAVQKIGKDLADELYED